jgi:glutathione S-transferase
MAFGKARLPLTAPAGGDTRGESRYKRATMLKLFIHPLSPYVQKVQLALYEKGIEFESSTPDLFGTPDAEFLRVSPRREIPALVDGDTVVFDSTIILEYIEERWPEQPLLPKAPGARARARALEELCDTYVEAINWGLVEIRVFGRGKGELADRLSARAGEQLKGVHAYLERELGDGPFFGGEVFGWGDISAFPHVATAATFGFAPPPGSNLAAWFARAAGRPSTQKVIATARQVSVNLPDVAGMVKSGALVRQYRDHRLEWMIRSGGLPVVLDGIENKTIRFSVELD